MVGPEPVGVAMLGYGFMGKAHSLALHALRRLDPSSPPATLVSICGRDGDAVQQARTRYGWADVVADWREQVNDERIDIFDNTGPNALHVEPTTAAIRAGKHVLCEKPLASTADEAHRLWIEAMQAGIVHMCGFNYRFLPAVRLARELIDAGEVGEPLHFRARYLASSALRDDQRHTWRFERALAGSGAVGDLGSHIIDLARYLVGEPAAVSATTKTIVPEREGRTVDVDDAFGALVEFENGASGTLEASRAAGRRSNVCCFEVDGTKASLSFDVQRLNELEFIRERKHPTTIDVTDATHPFMELWWPAPGHAIGWGESFTHELRHLLMAVRAGESVRPLGADFGDGYRCAEICDAILRAGETQTRQRITYLPADHRLAIESRP